MGPHFWRAPATKLKKCSEFTLNAECPKTVFDDCCAVVACDYCLEFDVYGEDLRTGIASFNGTEYSGSIAGAAFLLWVQRNYDTNECESVATLDGEEIDVLTCYDGMSCRNLSGSAEVTIGYDTGTLTWTKIEPKPLEHITDPDTNCKTWFCDECECTCDCLCVTITDSYDVVTEGEICDTTYDCDTPIWEGTVGDYVLSIALGRDDYGQCIITATVDGIEQAAVLAPGCGSMASTITLADGTTIAVTCKRCGCNDNGPLPCCPGFPAPDTLELDVTLNTGDCSCFALVGGSYSVTLYLVNRLPDYYEYHGIRLRPSGCNGGSSESTNVYDGFVFICRIDAQEGAELSVLQESSPVANPQPTIPITVTPDDEWVQDFAARSVNTEDCIFPLFVFEFGDSHALDSCEAEPPTDVTIVVYA